jgi:hypothetical protein
VIHVLKVTANARDAGGSDAELRHTLIVFVDCEDEGSAYAPADAYLRRTGWQDIELVNCRALPPAAAEKLDQSLRDAYQDADSRGVSAVLLKSF